MVFGFFSRKSIATPATTTNGLKKEPVAGPTSFVFPDQRQLHTPAPSISFSTPAYPTASPPPMPPPHTPSPPPADAESNSPPAAEPSVADPRALYALISTVPPQTLHTHCLDLLNPASFDHAIGKPNTSPKRRGRKKSTVNPDDVLIDPAPPKPHPLLTPTTLSALTAFFQTLVPPPLLHCVRCHKHYFELENSDWSCRVPHEDNSAIIERVGTRITSDTEEEPSGSEYGDQDADGESGRRRKRKSGVAELKSSIYETLWGCCGKTVEGDGDQGPPDGWCYEGRHTVDHKRARFRADSTPQDDKLVSCQRLKCFRPPVSQGSTNTPSARSYGPRKRKRNIKSIDYREPDDNEDELEKDHDQDDRKSIASSTVKRRKKDATEAQTPKEKGKPRPRKKAFKSKEEIDEADDADTDPMDVDQPAASTSTPRSPPASPRRKPLSSATASSSASAAPVPPKKTRQPRAKPTAPPSKMGAATKPAMPSPLGVRQDTTIIPTATDSDKDQEAGQGQGNHRSKSQVYVELPGRVGSKSPARGSTLTRTALNAMRASGSVASLRDRFEPREGADGERGRRAGQRRVKGVPLEEVVASSVDHETEMR